MDEVQINEESETYRRVIYCQYASAFVFCEEELISVLQHEAKLAGITIGLV